MDEKQPLLTNENHNQVDLERGGKNVYTTYIKIWLTKYITLNTSRCDDNVLYSNDLKILLVKNLIHFRLSNRRITLIVYIVEEHNSSLYLFGSRGRNLLWRWLIFSSMYYRKKMKIFMTDW